MNITLTQMNASMHSTNQQMQSLENGLLQCYNAHVTMEHPNTYCLKEVHCDDSKSGEKR